MKRYLYITCILLGILTGCTQKQEQHDVFPESLDLLSALRAQAQQETVVIDFRKDAAPQKYLLYGWGRAEQHFTWAIEKRSKILFYHYDMGQDIELELNCQAIPSPEGEEQETIVLLNGNEVGSIIPKPFDFGSFDLLLPASLLQVGQNILEFRFSYATPASELERQITSYKRLAVAFRELVFRKRSSHADISRKATTAIDFTDIATPEEYLAFGWSHPESDRIWADAERSGLFFYRYGPAKKDETLAITCMAMPSMMDEQQIVKVALNAQHVGSFTVKPGVFKTYKMRLPRSLIQAGTNLLEFHFAYTTKPSQLSQDSGDARPLTVAFKKIVLRNNDIGKSFDRTGLSQRADAQISIFSKLPKEFEVDVRYHSMNGAKPHIELINEDKDVIMIELPHKKKAHKETVALDHPGIYEIRVLTQGKPESFTLWEQIHVNLPKKETQGFYQSKQLGEYDVIYIIFDAFAAPHASLHGYSRKTTPFFDRLAETAVVFDNMFANASYTLASTGTLFTSTYPFEHGLFTMSNVLDSTIPNINELLAQAHVETCLITKHQYFGKEWGLDRGFSTIFFDQQYGRDPEAVMTAIDKLYASHPNQKKFVYVHFIPPHFPYAPPEEFRQFVPEAQSTFLEPTRQHIRRINAQQIQATEEQIEYIKSFYDSNVLFADHIAERLFEALKKRGLTEKSIIIFTSDHGEAFMQHGRMLHSSTVFDEMIHIPFIVHFPKDANIKPKRIEHVASLLDVAPTLTEIYDIQTPPEFAGTSLLPSIMHNLPVNDYIYAEIADGDKTVRDTIYKYILSPKYGELLFHLPQDPGEQHNRIDEFPVTAGYYRQLLREFSKQASSEHSKKTVDVNTLDKKTIEHLKELGYIQ